MRYKKERVRRKYLLRQHYPLDSHLIEVGQKVKCHSFLANPAGQNVFQYLTHLVSGFSEEYFGTNFNELQIVDWGCGKGHVTYLLRKLGGKVIPCDLVAGRGSSFAKKQKTPILEANRIEVIPLEHDYILPFVSCSVDVFLSFGVLEHVSDDAKSMQEINRVLRDGGLFFCFNLPYVLSWTQRLAHHRGNYYHDRLYTKQGTKKLIRENGLEIIDLWHRQLLPKNKVNYPAYQVFEGFDLLLTEYTPLKFLATNIEFIARKT